MTDSIKQKARSLIKRHNTRDPFVLAEKLGVIVKYRPDFKKLKGMYRVILGCRYIFLNSNMEDEQLRIVLAHEIGHDVLHRDLAADGFWQEYVLYDMRSRPEYEANVFASCLLLPDDEVYALVTQGMDVMSMAGELHTDVNLMAIKLAEMCKDGYSLRAPDLPKSDFLKE